MRSMILVSVIMFSSGAFASPISEVVCESSYQIENDRKTITFQVERNPEFYSHRTLIEREGPSKLYKNRTESNFVSREPIQVGRANGTALRYSGNGVELIIGRGQSVTLERMGSGELDALNRNLKCDVFINLSR